MRFLREFDIHPDPLRRRLDAFDADVGVPASSPLAVGAGQTGRIITVGGFFGIDSRDSRDFIQREVDDLAFEALHRLIDEAGVVPRFEPLGPVPDPLPEGFAHLVIPFELGHVAEAVSALAHKVLADGWVQFYELPLPPPPVVACRLRSNVGCLALAVLDDYDISSGRRVRQIVVAGRRPLLATRVCSGRERMVC